MPFIPVPGGVKVTMKYTKAGQLCANVFWVEVPSSPTPADLDAIGGTFKAAWQTHLFGYTSGDVTLTSIEVVDASVVGGLGIEYVTGLPLTGTPGLDGTPNNVTIATKLVTGRTGRSYRGRFYFIGVSPTYLEADQQHIQAVFSTHLVDFVLKLISDLQLLSFSLSVASLYSGVDADHKPIPRAAGVLTSVTNAVVNATLDSQRRRLPERGS